MDQTASRPANPRLQIMAILIMKQHTPRLSQLPLRGACIKYVKKTGSQCVHNQTFVPRSISAARIPSTNWPKLKTTSIGQSRLADGSSTVLFCTITKTLEEGLPCCTMCCTCFRPRCTNVDGKLVAIRLGAYQALLGRKLWECYIALQDTVLQGKMLTATYASATWANAAAREHNCQSTNNSHQQHN